ncbi:MAG: NADH-quinone oxidoreductase subunit J [Chloroflexi bacterium]|nr:NADH-quinone oxidoreductase subunit J [Chloroflexota bacterium]
MQPELIVFFVLGTVAVGSAIGMLLSRNAVYSALFLILNFATVAVFYLVLGAPFIAMVQVTVYAGAIMVLFLFVIMLLGAEHLERRTGADWQKPIAALLGVVLLVEAGYVLLSESVSLPGINVPAADYGAPVAIGELLFSEYLLPFEVTSVLLLAAMVGAIVITRRDAPRRKKR